VSVGIRFGSCKDPFWWWQGSVLVSQGWIRCFGGGSPHELPAPALKGPVEISIGAPTGPTDPSSAQQASVSATVTSSRAQAVIGPMDPF
jgi:hypothetical protein